MEHGWSCPPHGPTVQRGRIGPRWKDGAGITSLFSRPPTLPPEVGGSTLPLADMSRFWTMFEAWLSFQVVSERGVEAAGGERLSRAHTRNKQYLQQQEPYIHGAGPRAQSRPSPM